jgi:hypothetical protein
MTAINVGDVWKRREPLDDPYDEIVVCGIVGCDGKRPDEYSIESAHIFGPVLQSDREGILQWCDLVSSGDDDAKWETEHGDLD